MTVDLESELASLRRALSQLKQEAAKAIAANQFGRRTTPATRDGVPMAGLQTPGEAALCHDGLTPVVIRRHAG